MYRIKRATMYLKNGDKKVIRLNIPVMGKAEMEAYRQDLKQEHNAEKVNFNYGEVGETDETETD